MHGGGTQGPGALLPAWGAESQCSLCWPLLHLLSEVTVRRGKSGARKRASKVAQMQCNPEKCGRPGLLGQAAKRGHRSQTWTLLRGWQSCPVHRESVGNKTHGGAGSSLPGVSQQGRPWPRPRRSLALRGPGSAWQRDCDLESWARSPAWTARTAASGPQPVRPPPRGSLGSARGPRLRRL